MRPIAIMLMCAFCAAESKAQVAVELSYGADRNVDSPQSELDGWMNGTVEWMFPSGLGVGIGTDHQFEGAAITTSDHLGWAIYLSTSYEYPTRMVAPFVRGGVGLGRAPCRGDTCGDGAHFRGSAGVRIRIVDELRVSGAAPAYRIDSRAPARPRRGGLHPPAPRSPGHRVKDHSHASTTVNLQHPHIPPPQELHRRDSLREWGKAANHHCAVRIGLARRTR